MARWSLLKSLVLLLLLTITVLQLLKLLSLESSVFTTLQVVFGALYFLFSILDFLKNNSAKNLPELAFNYLPLNIISKTAIRLVVFSVIAIVLFVAEANLKSMSLLILIYLLNDLTIFLLRYKKKSYYLCIYPDHLSFHTDRQEKLFVGRIKEVEFRHNIFYFTMLSNSVRMVELDIIDSDKQDQFKTSMIEWIVKNKLVVTDEAKVKLAI